MHGWGGSWYNAPGVMSPKTLIFIPTYNERENVGPMCEQIFALGLDADLLFMDDGSPDGTGQLLDTLAAEHSRMRVVHRAGKAGIGSAHKAGIKLAYDEGYERLVTLDCDFTHRPEMIGQFLERCDTADAVVGSRYLETGSLPGWSALRKSLTTLGHVLTKNMLGISQDATGAFRAYNLTKISRELFDLVQSNGYAFFFESMLVLQRNGLAIAEIPIMLPARTYGSSKMTVDEVRRSVATLLTLFIQDQTNPGRFRPGKTSVVIDPALVDPQNWNEYWDAKSAKAAAVYDLAAALYRNTILKRQLESTISREFQPGARLLHAGCGGGPVDANLHQQVRITAVDISPSALDFYRRSNPEAEEVRHADIMALPFPNGTFDGAYNLGVVEHFDRSQLAKVFSELRRVLKPNGKLVVFWPHAHGTSVTALGAAHWLLNDVLHKSVRLHPPELSLVHSAREAAELLASGGFELKSYEFGPKDLFVQAKIVATCQ
jgi:dolichol-phosphate mannosyltransferase